MGEGGGCTPPEKRAVRCVERRCLLVVAEMGVSLYQMGGSGYAIN